MGSVVPFPVRRPPREAESALVGPRPGEVVILPVVQFVRPATVPAAPVPAAVGGTPATPA